jgi:hypothetical protein
MDFVFTEADIKGLDASQQAAIFDSLAAAIFADGKVELAEMQRYEKEVTRIPWGRPTEALTEEAKQSGQRLKAITTPDQFRDFLANIATKLPTQELREKVIALVGSIVSSDNDVNLHEKTLLGAFATAFNITTERFKQIRAAVMAGR